MREWIIFAVLLVILLGGVAAFSIFIREVRGVRGEMHEINQQLKNLNEYMERIAH